MLKTKHNTIADDKQRGSGKYKVNILIRAIFECSIVDKEIVIDYIVVT